MIYQIIGTAVSLIIAGLIHEFGHRMSLDLFGHAYVKKPFKTTVLHYEHLTKGEKTHMLLMGILIGYIAISAATVFFPFAGLIYIFGCHSDIKELLELRK